MGEFRIYERLGEKEILIDTIVGNSMVFDNYDEDTNYRLAAYEKTPDGQEKELDFYYIYGKEYQELLVAGMPTIVMSLEDLLKGTYMGYDISYPLDWTLPEISSRNERGRILAFRIFHPLLKEYLQTGEEKYGEICLNYIESWLDDYSVVPLEEDDDMWSDFCVARRVQFFSVARILFDHQIDNELLEKLEFHLEQCCDLLISKFYYKDKHNHGMMQDFALLTYLDAFGYLETHREEYTELAYDRLWEYFNFSIAADGVHKEHSPAYHVDILNSLEWITEYSSAQGNPRFGDKADALVDKMYRFYLDLTEPDFTVPPLGDSYCVIDYPNSIEGYEYGEWLLSKGQDGLAPDHTMAVYPEGGYAFMRSSWTDPAEEATWICLTAATHSTAHKHQDDLSFILYHKGQLFTEAGKRDYNYDDLETTYAYSSYAHNVLFVNYEGWPMNAAHHPVIDHSAYRTQITDFGQNDDIMWATGRSERWETVLQERTICYDPKDHFVSIRDRLTAAGSENIRLIYHIAEGIEITQEEDGWILARDGSEIAVVHVNATSDCNLSVLQGEEQEGEFKTWLFDQSHVDTPMYGGLLMVDMVCAEGENSIELQIELK